MANENDRARSKSRSKTPKKYKVPKVGDRRGDEVFTKRGWAPLHNAVGEYGGPYENICDLFKNRKYQSDMRDIYGIPFEPSKAEDCRDREHLDYWDDIRHRANNDGFYIPPRARRNNTSRNRVDKYFADKKTRRRARTPSRRARTPSRR